MTLLEALVALVILGLSAVGYLDVFRSSAGAVRDAGEWEHVVTIAETAMEGATLGDAFQAQRGALGDADRAAGYQQRIDVVPWRDGVDEIVVTVTSPRGTTFALRRLTRQHQATRERLTLPGRP